MQQSLGRCEPCFLRAHWKSGYLRSGPGPCVLFPFFVRHPRNGSVAEALELKVDVGFQAMAVLLAVAGPQPKIQGAGPAPNPEAASAHFDGSLGAHRQGRCGAKCQFCLGSGSKFVGPPSPFGPKRSNIHPKWARWKPGREDSGPCGRVPLEGITMRLLVPKTCTSRQAAGLPIALQTGPGVTGVEQTETPKIGPLGSRRFGGPTQVRPLWLRYVTDI